VTPAAAVGEDAVTTPIVAIRTMGLALESLVGVQRGAGGAVECTVSPAYLRTLLDISHERFAENAKRIRRFEAAVEEALRPPRKSDGSEWEDAAARRERKRAEGLRRKAELASREKESKAAAVDQDTEELDLPLNTDFAP
jgi:tRNA wybutosine-synthesizing protein 3